MCRKQELSDPAWQLLRIVEKPYYVIFASCWVCALMQQLIDTSRYYEERYEELSKTPLDSS